MFSSNFQGRGAVGFGPTYNNNAAVQVGSAASSDTPAPSFPSSRTIQGFSASSSRTPFAARRVRRRRRPSGAPAIRAPIGDPCLDIRPTPPHRPAKIHRRGHRTHVPHAPHRSSTRTKHPRHVIDFYEFHFSSPFRCTVRQGRGKEEARKRKEEKGRESRRKKIQYSQKFHTKSIKIVLTGGIRCGIFAVALG